MMEISQKLTLNIYLYFEYAEKPLKKSFSFSSKISFISPSPNGLKLGDSCMNQILQSWKKYLRHTLAYS